MAFSLDSGMDLHYQESLGNSEIGLPSLTLLCGFLGVPGKLLQMQYADLDRTQVLSSRALMFNNSGNS